MHPTHPNSYATALSQLNISLKLRAAKGNANLSQSSIFLAIKLFITLSIVKKNQVDQRVFFRKLHFICSLSLQQGALKSLNVNASSFAFHNIPKVLTEGNSPHLKLSFITFFSFGISFKTSDSFDTHFVHTYQLFPITLITVCIALLLHHWS